MEKGPPLTFFLLLFLGGFINAFFFLRTHGTISTSGRGSLENISVTRMGGTTLEEEEEEEDCDVPIGPCTF
jgi:hypothetical protein